MRWSPTKRALCAVILSVALGLLLVAGLIFFGPKATQLPSAPVSLTRALDFTLMDLEGKPHKLSSYRGKIVFLNFWATWCPPCREEMPSMQKLYDSWNKKKFVMLAVNLREPGDRVKSFADKNGYTFPILLDTNGEVAAWYQVSVIPTTFLIDEKGDVVKKTVGSREWTLKDII